MKQALLVIVVGFACLAAGYVGHDLNLFGGLTRATPDGASSAVPDVVHALGRVEPAGGVYSIGAPVGAKIAALAAAISEGKEVHEGEILATLEGHRERQAEVDQITAQIADARKQEALDAKEHVILSERVANERKQLITYSKLENDAQHEKIKLLASYLANSKERLESQRPFRGRTVSEQDYHQLELVVKRDEAELVSATAMLRKMEAGFDIDQKKVDLEAQETELAPQKAALARRVKTLEINRELAQARLEQALIKVPTVSAGGRPGEPALPRKWTILKVNAHAGETVGQKPILQLGDTSRMYVVAEVYETDRARVAVGQSAEIDSPALGRILTGRVENVSPMIGKNDILGLDPASDAYARVVEVRIAIDPAGNSAAQGLTNLQAAVKIHTPQAPSTTPIGREGARD